MQRWTHNNEVVTGVKPQLPDIFPSLVVKVVDDRFQPGVVRVARIINVATVHLTSLATHTNHRFNNHFIHEPRTVSEGCPLDALDSEAAAA